MSQRFPPVGGVGGPSNTNQARYPQSPMQPGGGGGPMRPYTAGPLQNFPVSISSIFFKLFRIKNSMFKKTIWLL